MFKGNKPVTYKSIRPNVFQRVLTPVSNKIFSLDKTIVRSVSEDVLRVVWPNAKDADKERIFDVVFAILKGVDEEVLSALTTLEPYKVEDMATTKYKKYQELKKIDFDSPFPAKRMLARSLYYEEAFKQRSFIQNWRWEHKDLDEDAETFIKCREKYKLYAKDYREAKGRGKECFICHHTCVTRLTNICSYCTEFDTKMHLFIKLSCAFQTMGSYFLFNWYLSETTWDYLLKNFVTIIRVFGQPIGFSLIEKYSNYIYLMRLVNDEEAEAKETQKIKEEEVKDEMFELVLALEDQEKKKKKKEVKELLKEFRKEKRLQKKLYAVQTVSAKEATPKIEEASQMKSILSNNSAFKPLDQFGDKSII